MNLLNSRIQGFTFSILLFGCATVLALSAQDNVVLVNNAELSFCVDGSVSEFDSLPVEYHKWCTDRNEFANSYKVARHRCGNNNPDFLSIVEVKSWEDDLKFIERSVELFEEHWDTPQKGKHLMIHRINILQECTLMKYILKQYLINNCNLIYINFNWYLISKGYSTYNSSQLSFINN